MVSLTIASVELPTESPRPPPLQPLPEPGMIARVLRYGIWARNAPWSSVRPALSRSAGQGRSSSLGGIGGGRNTSSGASTPSASATSNVALSATSSSQSWRRRTAGPAAVATRRRWFDAKDGLDFESTLHFSVIRQGTKARSQWHTAASRTRRVIPSK